MKNTVKRFLRSIIILTVIVITKNVYAFDSNNYKYRALCDNYEVAAFRENGNIETIKCSNNYEQARDEMKNNGDRSLVVLTKVNGLTTVIDANVGLLDLTINPDLTYFYTSTDLSSWAYTYMDTGSLYGGVDGAHIETTYSNGWAVKVKIGNFTGWIALSTAELVPITWVKSSSNYTVTNEDIRHNYVAKIQEYYNGSAGRVIGPKPEMLNPGTYYSYDGHYFYNNLDSLIRDYKNNTYKNSVNNNNPYYNYYMYLSNHTKTNYSSINIDEYIRNNLGYYRNAYGNSASSGASRLYGSGTFFYYAQQKYGVNAILALSLSRNETGNGRSNLAINKNNGFGLNAVDSNPTQAANWYASFHSSILGYASKWITYGYAHPRDWRYFGPQFGDKWIGMNVKYASDTYWSEKMAANYYSFDKAFGLQDYNYYQLGVVNGPTNAYSNPNTSSRVIYQYPEREDALVIIEELTSNNEKWYKVVSDLNIDSNYNEIYSGDYNWNSFVYVKASDVRKINNSKNGPISPNEVTEYQDSNYTYDLYIENTELKPKVAVSIKNTDYYFDSTLNQKIGSTLLKDRYVMVYTAAYENGYPVSYLVTSDYWHDQKHWVSADSIKFTNTSYGKVNITLSGNMYTWVNYNREDQEYSVICGLFTNSYVPVLESSKVGNDTWYKVPVSLTTNDNIYGYTLAYYPGITVTLSTPVVENTPPKIKAVDKIISEGDSFNPLENVEALDNEDGNITNKIIVVENNVNNKVPGEYKVTYEVTDSSNNKVTSTIKVTVKENKPPVLNVEDTTIEKDSLFDPLSIVSAKDEEDGNITNKVKVIKNTVNTKQTGNYEITYEVEDSKNKKATKTINVTVKDNTLIEVTTQIKKDGEFYLDSLLFDKDKKQFKISGYLIIKNHNNSTNKKYYLILKDKNQDKSYEIEVSNWIDNVPYNIGVEDNYNYSASWFNGYLDLSNIPNGDYDLYMKAIDNNIYSEELVDNLFNKPIDKRGEDDNKGYNFKVFLNLKSKKIELNIRDELYTTSSSPTFRTMVNDFEDIKWSNNKLYILGYSYNYNATYSNEESITRTLILENKKTYKQYYYNLGSKIGPFQITTKDNKDKNYIWYENEIDLSNLDKGEYSLMVYTKTIDAADYGELTDILGILPNTKTTIDNKTYTIKLNKERQNRVEIIVE